MKRELIYTDRGKMAIFQKQINEVLFKSNDLIRIFTENQPFIKINTRNEAESLILGPLDFYDSIILENIKLPANNSPVNVSALADLYNIPRSEFIRLIGLTPDQVSGCDTCKPSKTIKLKGGNIISINEYNSFAEFLIWENGSFDLNNSAIEIKKESCNIYAESEKEIEFYNHYLNLAKILNSHIEIAKIGPEKITQLANITGLLILNNTLVLNNMKLSETIQYLKLSETIKY